jgi:hypothetical protein
VAGKFISHSCSNVTTFLDPGTQFEQRLLLVQLYLKCKPQKFSVPISRTTTSKQTNLVNELDTTGLLLDKSWAGNLTVLTEEKWHTILE